MGQSNLWTKKVLPLTLLGLGALLIIGILDYQGLLNRQIFTFKTPPCTTGTCNHCYGLTIVGVCLGIQKVTTTVTTENAPTVQTSEEQSILVTSLKPGHRITSPLELTGQARGGWYFEGSFPVTLVDSSNQVLGQTTAQAQTDWQTEAMVSFVANLTFSPQSSGSTGTLIFSKDNPSGLPENAQELRLSVIF